MNHEWAPLICSHKYNVACLQTGFRMTNSRYGMLLLNSIGETVSQSDQHGIMLCSSKGTVHTVFVRCNLTLTYYLL